MVSEEKRQFKELVSRLNNSEKCKHPILYLGSSQTLRDLYELTGQVVDPRTFQMSIFQDQASTNPSGLSPTRNSSSGRKRTRSETSTNLEDSISDSSSPKSSASALSTKDLFCLMSTLNICFGPTYNFLTARSDEFCLEPELRNTGQPRSWFYSLRAYSFPTPGRLRGMVGHDTSIPVP
uniref:Repressor of RNA polymerase III transcription MAF1 homolog n=1 Tax=Trichobilharzia regenti TaxID=157069 RepID=A0AA85KBN5_TRIRE|nr:unnamed protein product [Trichobilharzia regenti]